MSKDTFETELWDLITPNQREIVQSIIANLSAEEADKTEETVQKIQTNNSSTIQSISTPGYNMEFISNPDSLGEYEKPDGIEKNRVLLEVLTGYFGINSESIFQFEEEKQQEHLNTKYFSYYVEIEGKGLVIIINNQYKQALRIKAIEPIQEENKIVETITTLIENKTKMQLDEDLGFTAHSNTYESTEALNALYVEIIQGELGRESQIEETLEIIELTGSPEEIWKQIKGFNIEYRGSTYQINKISDLIELSNDVIMKGKIGKTLVREIINAMLELKDDQKITSHTQGNSGSTNIEKIDYARNKLRETVSAGELGEEAKVEYKVHLESKIDLTKSAEEIWEQIKTKTIKVSRSEKKLNSIIDLLTSKKIFIITGKIENTPLREIINAMLRLEDNEKINSKLDKGNKTRMESAIKRLQTKVSAGELGEEAKIEYEKHLESKIDLTRSTEEIWEQIKTKTIKARRSEKKLNSIIDLVEMGDMYIYRGKIGKTLVREIINAMLRLEDKDKITHHDNGEQLEANTLRVKVALDLLQTKVSAGELGEEAKVEYKEHLESKIDLTGSAEEIWKQIETKTIKTPNSEKILKSIIDLLTSEKTFIVTGKIGETRVREIINVMLRLEDEDKITHHNNGEQLKANTLRVKAALELLKQKVLDGKLGEKAKAECEIFKRENTPECIWTNKIIGKQLLVDGVDKGIMSNITSITSLAKSSIKSGKIDGITLRSILNSLLKLDDKSKIRSESNEQNNQNIEAAVELLKSKALEGELGEEAQREMQTIIDAENIQAQTNLEIQKI